MKNAQAYYNAVVNSKVVGLAPGVNQSYTVVPSAL
jgi:hypothetical protein